MSLQWEDESFAVWNGLWSPPNICLSVQPGVVDFPARCKAMIRHRGRHCSPVQVQGTHFPPIYWTNEDE